MDGKHRYGLGRIPRECDEGVYHSPLSQLFLMVGDARLSQATENRSYLSKRYLSELDLRFKLKFGASLIYISYIIVVSIRNEIMCCHSRFLMISRCYVKSWEVPACYDEYTDFSACFSM